VLPFYILPDILYFGILGSQSQSKAKEKGSEDVLSRLLLLLTCTNSVKFIYCQFSELQMVLVY